MFVDILQQQPSGRAALITGDAGNTPKFERMDIGSRLDLAVMIVEGSDRFFPSSPAQRDDCVVCASLFLLFSTPLRV